jgi:hypothetical protein
MDEPVGKADGLDPLFTRIAHAFEGSVAAALEAWSAVVEIYSDYLQSIAQDEDPADLAAAQSRFFASLGWSAPNGHDPSEES